VKASLEDWLGLYSVSVDKLNALCAIYENGGPEMLNKVLKAKEITLTAELVKAQSKNDAG
jgi:hypothetical protein